MSGEVILQPIDGAGFSETVDGKLAAPFSIELTEEAIDVGAGVVGWRATALEGKYVGAHLTITPRHKPWSGVVVLRVCDAELGFDLYSGMADSTGLKPSWQVNH